MLIPCLWATDGTFTYMTDSVSGISYFNWNNGHLAPSRAGHKGLQVFYKDLRPFTSGHLTDPVPTFPDFAMEHSSYWLHIPIRPLYMLYVAEVESLRFLFHLGDTNHLVGKKEVTLLAR